MSALREADVAGPATAGRVGVSLSVVIPVYNEEDILPRTVAAIVAALRSDDAVRSFEVVVAENGSRDRTRQVARDLASRYGEVVLLESDVADYGAAMRAGFRAAGGSFVVNFDADYYDVEFLRRALDVDADIVVAAKQLAGSVDTRALLRRVVSRCFGLLVRALLGLRTTETHGMKVFRRAAIEPLLPAVTATKDLFDTELVARAEHDGLRIVELPIRTEEMRHSRSAIFRRIPRTMWGLVRMRGRLRRGDRPGGSSAGPERAAATGPSRLQADDPVPGQRLLPVGAADVAVRGVEEALVALDESGVAVLVLAVDALTPGTGGQIADELDRVAALGATRISRSRLDGDGLAEAHRAFFDLPANARPRLNHDQRAVVLVRQPPDRNGWAGLVVELGRQLAGVYLDDGEALVPLEAPGDVRPGQAPRRRAQRATLTAALILVLGVVAVLAAPSRGPDATSPDAPAARSAVGEVATGVPAAATHNHWIGQDHVVRTSGGTLLAVHGSHDGLWIVADHGDHGRVWRSPVVVPDIRATSSSVAVDDDDRLHVAFSDGSRVAYATVQERGGRWTSAVVELDGRARTPYVDVAYDRAAGLAHVVWVEDGPDGQSPRWAAVSDAGGAPRVAQTARLAPAGSAIPALVNVAAGQDSSVLVTYRRADSPPGWFARALTGGADGRFTLGTEEQVPTTAVVGAGALVVDRSGVAHLVLRDSSAVRLAYHTRSREGTWSAAETAVAAETIEAIDLPSLTLDRSSRLVYLFFHSSDDRAGGVQVALRHPSQGWQAPRPVAPAGETPGGAFHPTAIAEAAGAPTVLWTSGGPDPALQAAVIAP